MGTNKDYIEYVHKVYDYLHTIPEKGFEEYKTSEFVLKELEKMGFENINKGVAGTGIIVTIDSKKRRTSICYKSRYGCIGIYHRWRKENDTCLWS